MKQFNVTGMSCAACSARVERAVSAVEGVKSCSVNLLTNSMTVEGDASDEVIIASVVNIFLGSETLYWIVSYAGVIIFVGLAAYDTQKIKQMFIQYGSADEMGNKIALLGALTLYLDFINLFLFLIRILGDRR